MEVPILRHYQEGPLREAKLAFRDVQSVLIQGQTGSGKGTQAAYVTYHANRNGMRVLFVVDRRPIVNDFSENRLDRYGVPHGIIMGNDRRRKAWLNNHVACIPTLYRRIGQLPKADLIIIDEARASSSPMWQAVINAYPKTTKVLGFDATPQAPGGRGLGRASGGLFDVLIQGASTRQLISEGFLVPCRTFHPEGMGDKSKLKMQGDDFTHKSQVEVCATREMVGNAVEKYLKIANGRKAVFFGVDQEHCRRTAEEFNAAGIKAAYVGSDTPDGDLVNPAPGTRRWVWEHYDNRDLMVICSYGVICAGWDHPICSCVILGRAVGSMTLLRQMMGRGSRPYPGKKDFLVIDHWDSCKELDVAFDDDVEWNLDGTTRKLTERDTISMSTCKRCRQNFRTGPKACPYCGAAIEKQIREVEAVAGELVEFKKKAMTAAEWQERLKGNDRYVQYKEMLRIQHEKKYKPTYAWVSFRSMFGHQPPKQWTDTAWVEILGPSKQMDLA